MYLGFRLGLMVFRAARRGAARHRPTLERRRRDESTEPRRSVRPSRGRAETVVRTRHQGGERGDVCVAARGSHAREFIANVRASSASERAMGGDGRERLIRDVRTGDARGGGGVKA